MSREVKSYVAITKFNIGIDDSTAITIMKGDAVEFDGVKATIGGDTMNLPKLRAAVREGWLEPAAAQQSTYQAPSANLNLRRATPQQEDRVHDGSTSVADEERVVHTVDDRKEFAGSTTSDDQEARAKTRSSNTSVMDGANRDSRDRQPRNAQVISDTQEGQDVGHRFKTSAKSNVDLSKMSGQQLNNMVHNLENKPATPAKKKMATTEESQTVGSAKRVAEGIAFENHNVGDRSAIGVEDSGQGSGNPFADDARAVGRVGQGPKAPATEVPSGEVVVEETLATRKATVDESVELDDSLDPKTREGRYEVAKLIHPELPDWDFAAHWAHKMERLREDHSDDALTLRAIYASESDAIKRRIKEEFGI